MFRFKLNELKVTFSQMFNKYLSNTVILAEFKKIKIILEFDYV